MIIQLLWLLLPAMVANMAPVFAAGYHLLPTLNRPLDGGRTWRGARLLGDHKTIRGFVVGALAGAATAGLQSLFSLDALNIGTPLQQMPSALAFGAYLGTVALLGDAAKSFLKRRLRIKPGKPWPVFDQTDFAAAALLALTPFLTITFLHAVAVTVIIGLASVTVSIIGFNLRLKSDI